MNRDRSIIGLCFLQKDKLRSELDTVCCKYEHVCKLQRSADDSYRLIRLERRRRRLFSRMCLLSFRLGVPVSDQIYKEIQH